MKLRYRLFQRSSGIFFLEDRISKKQESLKTRDKTAALRIFNARNESHQQPAINLQIARAYLMASDPLVAQRTWQHEQTSRPDKCGRYRLIQRMAAGSPDLTALTRCFACFSYCCNWDEEAVLCLRSLRLFLGGFIGSVQPIHSNECRPSSCAGLASDHHR